MQHIFIIVSIYKCGLLTIKVGVNATLVISSPYLSIVNPLFGCNKENDRTKSLRISCLVFLTLLYMSKVDLRALHETN